MNKRKVPWRTAAFPSQGLLGGRPEIGSKCGWRPTAEQIRKMMADSSEGGRAVCYLCRTGFSMQHIVLAKIEPFRTEFVCKDCLRESGLQKIK